MSPEEEDDTYRAIGRYIVAFSHLIAEMRISIESQFVTWEAEPERIELVLGEAPADQITNAFFAVCEHTVNLDDEERKVATHLKTEVRNAIRDRNDVAHGDWATDFDSGHPVILRTKPGRRAGPRVHKVRSIQQLNAMADALAKLTDTVREFAWLTLGGHPLEEPIGANRKEDPDYGEASEIRVREIFRFRNRGIVRKGRRATEWPADHSPT
jgi:hypothetical protein